MTDEKNFKGDKAHIECFTRKSKDGKYLVHKTVITHIQRVEDVEAVLQEVSA